MATLYTVGHGARSEAAFRSLLREALISVLVDVRAFPSSRRHPQFSQRHLAGLLQSDGICYDWQGAALGGLRKEKGHSVHTALTHPMFRAYAQHMEGRAFVLAAQSLAERAASERICVMCAERDPAHCHRSLIADWWVAHGHAVVHLLEERETQEHRLNPLARLEEGRLVYGGVQKNLF